MSESPSGVPLAEMIQNLRQELEQSMESSADAKLRFAVDSIELEAEVAVRRATKGKAGLEFWVVSAGGEASVEHENTQTLRLKLRPVTGSQAAESGEVLVSRSTTQLPD